MEERLEETLEEARVTIRHLLAEESYNQQRIGELYNHVVAHRLAEAAGYKDALEYFAEHVPELPSAPLARYGAVAREFSPEACARYGVTCLSLLLAYAKAAGLAVDSADPGRTPIQVPGEEGQTLERSFARCGLKELHGALRTQQALRPGTALPGR